MRAFFLFPLPSKTFFLFRHLSDPVCFAFFRCHQPHVAPRMNSKVFTPNTTYLVEILCKTAHDLAIILSRGTFAAKKAKQGPQVQKRGLEDEQWNEQSDGNALPYRSPCSSMERPRQARSVTRVLRPECLCRWTRRLQRKSHSACAFRERDQVTFHAKLSLHPTQGRSTARSAWPAH